MGEASSFDFTLKTAKNRAFTRALEAAGGNIIEAAKLLGVSRVTVDNHLKRLRKEEYDRERLRLERHRKLKGQGG